MIEGHGDDSYKYSRPITANFSSNVYNRVDLSALKAHLCARIDGIGNYPEPEPYTLEACLARRHRLPAEAVCVTNGATEAIYLTAQTFRGTNTAIVQPTFSEYADACRMHGHRVTSSTGFLRRARGIACRKRCACCGCAIPITLPERLWRRNIWQHLSVIIRRSVSSSTSPTSFSPCVRFSLLPRLRSFPTSCCCTP